MISSRTLIDGAGLERVHYFPRQLLTAEDMEAEQRYFRQKLRRHNRFLHGWGVVCGCEVKPAHESTSTKYRPWQVWVCPGYVVSPQGDEIWIGKPFLFDLAGDWRQAEDPCEEPGPCPPSGRRVATGERETVYLAVRYDPCDTRPVRVHPVGCGCDEAACEYSRIRDDFELARLPTLPASHERAAGADADWCACFEAWAHTHSRRPAPVPPCPECPDDPWVALATIILPTERTTPIGAADISYRGRRALYTVTTLLCCCLGRPSPPSVSLLSLTLNPATVVGGSPSQGTVTLSGPAPAGGAVVALSSRNPQVATVPASVTVPANATTATFQVTTTQVTANTRVVITASREGVDQTAPLTVQAVQAPLLKVNRIRILHDESVLGELPAPPPSQRLRFLDGGANHPGTPKSIEIQFVNAAVNVASVIAGQTFKVEPMPPNPRIVQTAANTVRFVCDYIPGFHAGDSTYTITLVGDGSPAITSQDGRRLDGELTQYPSGNGQEGGNLVFQIEVIALG